MKTLIFALATLLLVNFTYAQNVIDKHFSHYKDQDNVTRIHMSGKMFELASYIEVEEENEDLVELKEFISTVKAFNMIIAKKAENPAGDHDAALKLVQHSHEELMHVVDQEGSFNFLINESKGVVYELVMVGMAKDAFMVFSLEGNMDLRKLSKLTQAAQGEGFRYAGKMAAHGFDDIKVYPNPVEGNAQLNIEVPEALIGGTATLYNINGAAVKRVSLTAGSQEVGTEGLASGTYVMEFSKDKLRIKKKLIIQ